MYWFRSVIKTYDFCIQTIYLFANHIFLQKFGATAQMEIDMDVLEKDDTVYSLR